MRPAERRMIYELQDFCEGESVTLLHRSSTSRLNSFETKDAFAVELVLRYLLADKSLHHLQCTPQSISSHYISHFLTCRWYADSQLTPVSSDECLRADATT